MSKIAFDNQTRDELARLLARKLKDELDVEVGLFEAQDLLAFLAENLGPYFYNQGLYDAQAAVKGRLDSVVEAIEAIEKPVKR